MAKPKIPSYVPEEGWTQETFLSSRGERMLKAWTRAISTVKRRTMKELRKTVDDVIFEQVSEISRRVMVRKFQIEGIPIPKIWGDLLGNKERWDEPVRFNPAGDQSLWEESIREVLMESEDIPPGHPADIRTRTTGLLRDSIHDLFSRTMVLMGGNPTDRMLTGVIERRVQNLGEKITRVNGETARRLNRTITESIYKHRHTTYETVQHLRKEAPYLSRNRLATIARTEAGNAADEAIKETVRQNEDIIQYVSVIGCQKVEPGIPTFEGVPTCNIVNVPAQRADELTFHINHTGVIVPSTMRHDGNVDDEALFPWNEVRNEDTLTNPPELGGAIPSNSNGGVFPESLDFECQEGSKSWRQIIKQCMNIIEQLSPNATLVEDPLTGERYVMKSNGDALEEEMLTDQFYQNAGVNVPEFKRYEKDGQVHKLSRYVEGRRLSDLDPADKEKVYKTLRKQVGVDAAAGLRKITEDDVIVDNDGRVWRVGNSKQMLFRKGQRKDWKEFNQFADDYYILRKSNPEIYKDLPVDDLASQFEGIRMEEWAAHIKKENPELYDLLITRGERLGYKAQAIRKIQSRLFLGENGGHLQEVISGLADGDLNVGITALSRTIMSEDDVSTMDNLLNLKGKTQVQSFNVFSSSAIQSSQHSTWVMGSMTEAQEEKYVAHLMQETKLSREEIYDTLAHHRKIEITGWDIRAAQIYQGPGYAVMNLTLRGLEDQLTDGAENVAEEIRAVALHAKKVARRASRPVTKDTTIFRGEKGRSAESETRYPKGETKQLQGVYSTSSNEDKAKDFASGRTVITIKVPKGTRVTRLNKDLLQNDYEEEVLIPAGTEVEITENKKGIFPGSRKITLEVKDQESVDFESEKAATRIRGDVQNPPRKRTRRNRANGVCGSCGESPG